MSDAMAELAGRRVLVLGAGGFIGINLCHALTKSGCIVSGFGRRPRIVGAVMPDRWIDAEFHDVGALRAAMQEVDVVIHLLGARTPGASNADPAYEAIVDLPRNIALLSLMDELPGVRLVFLSSGGAVYAPDASLPIAETAPTDPISAYGVGKLATEKFIQLFHRLYGLDYVTLRVGNPYGPFQNPDAGQGLVAKLIGRARRGETVQVWGDGSAVRDYIHIDDVIAAIGAAIAYRGDTRLFNIGSGRGRSVRDVIADVAAAVGCPVSIEYLPGRTADVSANVLDCTRARSCLGWRPKLAWEDGLRSTIVWQARTLG